MRYRTAFLTLGAALALPAALSAQQPDTTFDLSRPVRAQLGGNLYFAQPVKEFAHYIKQGWGGNLNGTLALGDAGVFGVRFDAGMMIYGHERVRDQCIANCRVRLDVTTSNRIAYFGVGPQLTAPVGFIRPYVNAQIGGTWIWTDSQIEGTNNDNEPFASSTNLSDGTFSYGGAGGLLIPIASNVRSPVSLDIGARYLRNGRVEYLRKGDIIDQPSGPPQFNIQRSRADLVTYYVGVSVGVR